MTAAFPFLAWSDIAYSSSEPEVDSEAFLTANVHDSAEVKPIAKSSLTQAGQRSPTPFLAGVSISGSHRFAAACVVLGTLVIPGRTLRPLLGVLRLHDNDPVGREVAFARAAAYKAAL